MRVFVIRVLVLVLVSCLFACSVVGVGVGVCFVCFVCLVLCCGCFLCWCSVSCLVKALVYGIWFCNVYAFGLWGLSVVCGCC